jgi:hypothetical protein
MVFNNFGDDEDGILVDDLDSDVAVKCCGDETTNN